MSESVRVSVWRPLSGTQWAMVGVIDARESLSFEPRHQQPGVWSLLLPYTEQARKISKGRLVTFDYRSTRFTGRVKQIGPQADESGEVRLEVTGTDVLDDLAGVQCWPVPDAAHTAQTVARYEASGPAETVLRALILANTAREGLDVVIPASQGRGATVALSERFSNLLTVVQAKIAYAGLGVRMGLLSTSGTRADLTVEFFVPADKSNRVRLAHRVGTLRTWKQSDTAPAITRVIVGGGGKGTARVFRRIVDTAAEAEWGVRREGFVDARDTSNTATLDQRGAEALAEGVEQSAFELEAVEATGMRYGEHFGIGDKVTVQLLDDVAVVKPLGAVQIAEAMEGVTVRLVPGNPDATNPLFAQAAIVKSLRRQVGQLQREED